ncbi:Uncharacterised protein [Vibrio cholerae]|uniref:Uncharacterized protein n=1 Tax=Vibrio cholerae TaxID=666 RepID=A0A655ZRB4_VIBCL|nr:Uncharacterised protein [Vibrio cholerae]
MSWIGLPSSRSSRAMFSTTRPNLSLRVTLLPDSPVKVLSKLRSTPSRPWPSIPVTPTKWALTSPAG